MSFKQIGQTPKTFVLVFQTGDSLMETLSKLAKEHGLSAASSKGIGRFSSVRMAWFNWEK